MDHELSPDELESLLAAYAIDAVDDDERRAVEEHLRRSPAAEEEVARLREAAAMLAIAGGPPPEGLWEQLEAKLQVPEAGRPAAPVIGMERHRVTRSVPAPRERDRDRPSRRRPRLLAVAAAVVALVLVGGVVVVATRDSNDNPSTTAALAAEARRQPGARTATLVDDAGNELATAVVLGDGRGYLDASLPALPAGRTYQLWSVDGTQPVSLGLLGRDPSVVAFAAAPGTASLAVTDEVAGGVSAPTQAPVAVGEVRA
jgi:anti-sigma factor RsiW